MAPQGKGRAMQDESQGLEEIRGQVATRVLQDQHLPDIKEIIRAQIVSATAVADLADAAVGRRKEDFMKLAAAQKIDLATRESLYDKCMRQLKTTEAQDQRLAQDLSQGNLVEVYRACQTNGIDFGTLLERYLKEAEALIEEVIRRRYQVAKSENRNLTSEEKEVEKTFLAAISSLHHDVLDFASHNRVAAFEGQSESELNVKSLTRIGKGLSDEQKQDMLRAALGSGFSLADVSAAAKEMGLAQESGQSMDPSSSILRSLAMTATERAREILKKLIDAEGAERDKLREEFSHLLSLGPKDTREAEDLAKIESVDDVMDALQGHTYAIAALHGGDLTVIPKRVMAE